MKNCSILLVLLALSATAFSQARVVTRIRVSEGVTYSLADRKVLPEIADLKGQKLKAEVAVRVIISKTGDVKSVRGFKGDPSLFKRCEEAAQKWHYKPYILNGEPVEVDTMIEFGFKKDKVEVVVPPRQ